MKRHALAARTALAVLSIALCLSCSLMGPSTGGIIIPFPAEVLRIDDADPEPGSRALGRAAEYQYVRVYLESQGGQIALLPNGIVFEMKIPPEKTIVLKDIPATRNCTLFLTFSVGGGDSFRPAVYGVSKEFSIEAGDTKDVLVTRYTSPFSALNLNTRAPDTQKGIRVVKLGSIMYALANGVLTRSDSTTYSHPVTGATGINKGWSQNSDGSFDVGAERLWINTASGISILSADGATHSQLNVIKEVDGVETARTIKNVLESGTIHLNYIEEEKRYNIDAFFYQGAGTLGGAFRLKEEDSVENEWTWFDIDDYLEELSPTLKSAIQKSTNKLIADYWIDSGGTYGYCVVPALNNLRISSSIKTDISDLIDQADDPKTTLVKEKPNTMDYIDTFLDGNTITVPKIAAGSPIINGLSKAGNTLFVGTHLGVFKQGVDSITGELLGTATQVELGRMADVVRIRAKAVTVSSTTTVYTAILSQKGTVFILKNGVRAATYLFYTGTPEFKQGTAANPYATGDLFWTDDGLVVTGSNGAALLSNAELAKLL